MKIRHFINVRESMRVPMTQEIRAAELRNANMFYCASLLSMLSFLEILKENGKK